MAVMKVLVGVEHGRPWLEFHNRRDERVYIERIIFSRGNGPTPYYQPEHPLEIGAGQSYRDGSRCLEQNLKNVFRPGESEAVVNIRLNLQPQQAADDQPDRSFYVIRRAQDGQFTEFFPLQGSLPGQPSLLDALLESRHYGT